MTTSIVIIGAGIGGLTTAALLAQRGYQVTVLEAQTYPGGCASTFFHQGYRFDSGATLAGGFQPNGPHAKLGDALGIEWPIRASDPAWVVHLPDRQVVLSTDYTHIIESFPQTQAFWRQQAAVANMAWKLSAEGLPWPPTDLAEIWQLAHLGLLHMPLRLIPFGLGTVQDWLKRHNLHRDLAFMRFVDAQLLISAQTTSEYANGLYGATALDLARQGVNHVQGGIGGLAHTLVNKIRAFGGTVLYRHHVTQIKIENGRAVGVTATKGRRSPKEMFFPADFVVANLTPWSLDHLLGDDSPPRLQREVQGREFGWGAFVLHLGVQSNILPSDIADHHQIITTMQGPLGEGRSIFVSISPEWDTSRAPDGHRAVTVSTHTAVQPWWDLLERDPDAYQAHKADYTEHILNAIENVIPGFRRSLKLILPGSPVTYNFYTRRHLGMVGGFPLMSLFKARGPRTGVPNLRLVGDSIFPGQSTAGVTLGGMRVAKDVIRRLPQPALRRQPVYE